MTEIANAEQHAAWNGDSGHRWVAEAERRDRVLAPIAGALLAAADLRPGDRVLDVGCGCGATTLAAAGAVAPGGEAVGVDLSAPMLELARQRAADRADRVDQVDQDGQGDRAGSDVGFVLGDAQTHSLRRRRFTVAISRFGTMFFADQVAAFANLATALVPGGRLCLATWQPLEANDWLTVPGAALVGYGSGELPATEPGAPGMFAQSDPDAVTAVLHDAGYRDVHLDGVTVRLTLGDDPADAADYLAKSGIGRAVLATIPEHQHPAALGAVRAALADHVDHVDHVDSAGVRLPAAIWIVTATLG